MAKPLRSDDPTPQNMQFAHFGVLNDGSQSKGFALHLHHAEHPHCAVRHHHRRRCEEDDRHTRISSPTDRADSDQEGRGADRLRQRSCHQASSTAAVAKVEPPKIKLPDVKLPDPPKPPEIKMAQPMPVVLPAPPKLVQPPPAP